MLLYGIYCLNFLANDFQHINAIHGIHGIHGMNNRKPKKSIRSLSRNYPVVFPPQRITHSLYTNTLLAPSRFPASFSQGVQKRLPSVINIYL